MFKSTDDTSHILRPSQQLFNAADTAIVGLFDTSSSLAAVGTNGEIIALIVALSSGLSVGVNVLVAQQIGQHKEQNIIPIIRTAMSLAVMIGVAGLIIGQCISAPLLVLIKTPSDILASSVLYLRIYFHAQVHVADSYHENFLIHNTTPSILDL